MQPILSVTVPIKKIKGAARQRYGGDDGLAWCEWAFTQMDSVQRTQLDIVTCCENLVSLQNIGVFPKWNANSVNSGNWGQFKESVSQVSC